MEIAQTIAISNKRGERERYLKQFNSSTIMAKFFNENATQLYLVFVCENQSYLKFIVCICNVS